MNSLEYLLERAEEQKRELWDTILRELSDSEEERTKIYNETKRRLGIMRNCVNEGLTSKRMSLSKLTGDNTVKYYGHVKSGKSILGSVMGKICAYALACAEVNSFMGVIVAAPTAGSCGIMPSALIALSEEYGFDDDMLTKALVVSAGVGMVIANRATIAGAQGGCQAECGSAAAMSAAAVAYLFGGDPEACIHAATLAVKNSLGLTCDPVAGLVEVPCVKRNGVFSVIAVTCADMALSGIRSVIPPDEVIDAMRETGEAIPGAYRETSKGGLAVTPTGVRIKQELFGNKE